MGLSTGLDLLQLWLTEVITLPSTFVVSTLSEHEGARIGAIHPSGSAICDLSLESFQLDL